MSLPQLTNNEEEIVEQLRKELEKSEPSRRQRIVEKFILAALGSIPWVGGFLSAAASYKAEEGALKQDSIQTQWLEEHHTKIVALNKTLQEIQNRFDSMGEVIQERIQSEEYLALVRKAFRAWDEADTDEKRRLNRHQFYRRCSAVLDYPRFGRHLALFAPDLFKCFRGHSIEV